MWSVLSAWDIWCYHIHVTVCRPDVMNIVCLLICSLSELPETLQNQILQLLPHSQCSGNVFHSVFPQTYSYIPLFSENIEHKNKHSFLTGTKLWKLQGFHILNDYISLNHITLFVVVQVIFFSFSHMNHDKQKKWKRTTVCNVGVLDCHCYVYIEIYL